MTQPQKVLYTARVHTTGGRDGGASRSDDGRLDIRHSLPGSPGTGTNPSSSSPRAGRHAFEGAMGVVARKMKIALPADTAIDAEVDLCQTDGAYFLRARLNISLPGWSATSPRPWRMPQHEVCPYSKATRGNIDVVITVV
jgi:peroxiredoxin, Ohr subfamily